VSEHGPSRGATSDLVYPEALTPALADVLGLPNFRLHPIWMALREVGQDIAPRYEAEQAAALHFLIPIAIEHGVEWMPRAAEKLLALQEAHRAAQDGER
jgi:hypothetical protein